MRVPIRLFTILCVSVPLLQFLATSASGQVKPQIIQKVEPKLKPAILPGVDLVPPEVEQLSYSARPNATSTDPGLYLFPGQRARVQVFLEKVFRLNTGVKIRYSSTPSGFSLSGPTSVTVPAGRQFVEFDVVAPSSITSGTNGFNPSALVKAYVNDTTKMQAAPIGLRPADAQNALCTNPPFLSVSPATVVRQGSTATIRVDLPCAAAAETSVQVTSSNAALFPPPPGNVVTIGAGSRTGFYTAPIGNVLSTTTVNISAFIPNTSPLRRAVDLQFVVTE